MKTKNCAAKTRLLTLCQRITSAAAPDGISPKKALRSGYISAESVKRNPAAVVVVSRMIRHVIVVPIPMSTTTEKSIDTW